jgi:hypothetical protein
MLVVNAKYVSPGRIEMLVLNVRIHIPVRIHECWPQNAQRLRPIERTLGCSMNGYFRLVLIICEWKAVSWRLLFLDVVYKPIPALEQEHHGLVLNATPGLAL